MGDSGTYYAVIFTATFAENMDGYAQTAERMATLAAEQPGYLGIDHYFQDNREITVSYWRDMDAVRTWKDHPEHLQAQEQGRKYWYSRYKIEVARVERHYEVVQK